MAAARFQTESRKPAGSPRPKGREHAKDTLCRNVLIYGHCRYEDQGCAFNHDPNKNTLTQSEPKKTLNVESPAFTPALPAPTKAGTFSTQAAATAVFTPRVPNSGTPAPALPQTSDLEPSLLNPAETAEFIPGALDYAITHTATNGTSHDVQNYTDPFNMGSVAHVIGETQFNPFQDSSSIASGTVPFYPAQTTYNQTAQTLQYHLYADVTKSRENLLPYQKYSHEFFMPDKLREDMQKKSEAALQPFQAPNLPPVVGHYHSLAPLVAHNNQSGQKSATKFGYPSWVYRATSSKNGQLYSLRRLKGYRLTNESAIRQVQPWKAIDHPNIVSVIEAFTTQQFGGESSLVFVTDYFPMSKTLAEHHVPPSTNRFGRPISTPIADSVLWSYIVQIASAIKTVHAANLAIRCLDPTKIILTDKNRIRINACSILDVVKFGEQRSLPDLQQDDMKNLGMLILGLGVNNLSATISVKNAIDQFARNYTTELVNVVTWLITPTDGAELKSVDYLLAHITPHVLTALDSAQHAIDTQNSELFRELENGRMFRLITKLNTVLERPEHSTDRDWSPHGKFYLLSLFRDYTFHQVDGDGKAVLDLGHMIRCMNKLDAGIEEKVRLTSRDEQSVYVVTYKELNARVAAAFADLQKGTRRF